MTWLTLVSILPFVGFLLYLLLRGFAKPVAPGTDRASAPKRRFTLPRPITRDRGTIAGADFYQETKPAQPAGYQGGRFLRRYRLTADRGPHAGADFTIENLPARVGRGPQAAIRLDKDLSVSRQHAEVYQREGELRLRDLGSSHGTQLNGQPVADSLLRPGDRVKFGSTEMILQVEENPPQ
jgi:hypothetical protein